MTAEHIIADEVKRQEQNFKRRKATQVKNYGKNFYVLDTETSGFIKDGGKNEIIQIAILRYENGKEVRRHCPFFKPKSKVTKKAEKTHGITKYVLKEQIVKPISKG